MAALWREFRSQYAPIPLIELGARSIGIPGLARPEFRPISRPDGWKTGTWPIGRQALYTVTLSDAKTHLPKLLKEIVELRQRVTITRSGRPVGVLISIGEYEGLLETLEILADSELAAAVRQGLDEIANGDTLSPEDVWCALDR